MADPLTELRLDAFLQRLGSGNPTPGGGSASALAGAMAAALLHMVLELTSPREDGPDEATVAEMRATATSWQSELLQLVAADAAAYDAVVTARRLPRGSELEMQARSVQLSAAVREATRVPLQIARRGLAVLDIAQRVAAVGNRNAVSDVGVAGHLAAACVQGAALNVRINLPTLASDDPLRHDARAEIDELLEAAGELAAAVAEAVEARLG